MFRNRKTVTSPFTALVAAFVAVTAAGAGTIDMSWDPVSHPDLAGYRIYSGATSGNYGQAIDVGPATSTSLTGLPDCTTHYIAIRSVANDGSESADLSNEISGWPRPSVASVSPSQLVQGQTATVTIAGNNFKPDSVLEFDDPAIQIVAQQVDSCGQITAEIAVGLGADVGSVAFDVVHGDRVYGSAPPLLSVTADPTALVPKAGWSVTFVSSQETNAAPNQAIRAIDEDPNTFWHTRFSGGNDSHPHEIRIDMGALYDVAGARFLPRQDGSASGRIAGYELYFSATDGNWGAPAASGTLEDRADLQRVDASGSAVRYVRLVATSSVGGDRFASLAELDVEGIPAALPNQAPNGVIVEPGSAVERQAGQAVVFSASGSDPEDGTPASWHWDFGDPAVPDSNVQNPGAVTFANPGVYTVTLTVTDSEGLSDPTPATVVVTVVQPLSAVTNLKRTDLKLP